jgi:hypothetical protein
MMEAAAGSGGVREMTTFTAWVLHAKITDDPEGDLIKDMRWDLREHPDTFPPMFPDMDSLQGYLRWKRNACQAALDTVPGVWRRYQRWVVRNGSNSPPTD